MATLDQLFQAMGMFSNAAKEYGASQGIRDATTAVQDLNARADMDFRQKAAAQDTIAKQLQTGLAALGAPQAQIAAAVGAIQPPKITSAADALAQAQSTTDPEKRKALLAEAKQFASLEGETALGQQKPILDLKQQQAIELELLKRRGEKQGGLTLAQMLDEQRKDELQQIPGFVQQKGYQTRPEDAGKLREGTAEFASADKALTELQSLIAKRSAGSELTGRERAKAESLYGQLQISLKETSKLGALAGPDIEVLGEQLPKPTGMGSLFTTDANMMTKLKQTQDGLRNKFSNTMSSYGYQPVGKAAAAAATEQPAVQIDMGGKKLSVNTKVGSPVPGAPAGVIYQTAPNGEVKPYDPVRKVFLKPAR